MKLQLALFALCIQILPLNAYAMPMARLTLDSDPGDYIGQGSTSDIVYYPTNSDFFSAQIRRTIGSTNEPAELLFLLGTVTGGVDNTFALLFFGTDALGIPIQTGFYPDAERADFALTGHPGLDVSFQNRGCNTLTGNFTINNVAFSNRAEAETGSPIELFSASFEQHCEGMAPALKGTFTYSAFPIPEPGTFWLIGASALGLMASRHRKHA